MKGVWTMAKRQKSAKKVKASKKPTKTESLQEITELLTAIEAKEEEIEFAEIELESKREELKTAKGVWLLKVSELRELVRTRKRWAEEAKRQPLLNGAKKADADADAVARVGAAAMAWRDHGVEWLHAENPKITDAKIGNLHAAKLDTLGELADKMDQESTWWHKGTGIGAEYGQMIADALGTIRAKYEQILVRPEEDDGTHEITEERPLVDAGAEVK
jgi:hypothetical protein